MKEYQKPILEDETIVIEDIINGSLTGVDNSDPYIQNDDQGEGFSS